MTAGHAMYAEPTERQRWMAVLARATHEELEAFASAHELPSWDIVKGPETGVVMVEARAGGTGRRFNLGEATVTRAAVRLATGEVGLSYALGRDTRRAELAAVIDGLLQHAGWRRRVENGLIAPLAARQRQMREAASRKAAATKVDFFTLQRGDG